MSVRARTGRDPDEVSGSLPVRAPWGLPPVWQGGPAPQAQTQQRGTANSTRTRLWLPWGGGAARPPPQGAGPGWRPAPRVARKAGLSSDDMAPSTEIGAKIPNLDVTSCIHSPGCSFHESPGIAAGTAVEE